MQKKNFLLLGISFLALGCFLTSTYGFGWHQITAPFPSTIDLELLKRLAKTATEANDLFYLKVSYRLIVTGFIFISLTIVAIGFLIWVTSTTKVKLEKKNPMVKWLKWSIYSLIILSTILVLSAELLFPLEFYFKNASNLGWPKFDDFWAVDYWAGMIFFTILPLPLLIIPAWWGHQRTKEKIKIKGDLIQKRNLILLTISFLALGCFFISTYGFGWHYELSPFRIDLVTLKNWMKSGSEQSQFFYLKSTYRLIVAGFIFISLAIVAIGFLIWITSATKIKLQNKNSIVKWLNWSIYSLIILSIILVLSAEILYPLKEYLKGVGHPSWPKFYDFWAVDYWAGMIFFTILPLPLLIIPVWWGRQKSNSKSKIKTKK